MSTWSETELSRIERADELQIASRRADGTLRNYVIVWMVRVDDDIYVRSAAGTDNPWFRRAKASGTGRIRAGGVEKDVDFAAPLAPETTIDEAYRTKYARYGLGTEGGVFGPDGGPITIRLAPITD